MKTPKRHFEINWTLESVPPPPLQFFGPSAVPELTMLDVGSPSRFTEEYWLFYSIEKPKTLYVAALKSNFDWIWSVWKWLFIQNYNHRIVKKKKVCLVPFLYSYYVFNYLLNVPDFFYNGNLPLMNILSFAGFFINSKLFTGVNRVHILVPFELIL